MTLLPTAAIQLCQDPVDSEVESEDRPGLVSDQAAALQAAHSVNVVIWAREERSPAMHSWFLSLVAPEVAEVLPELAGAQGAAQS